LGDPAIWRVLHADAWATPPLLCCPACAAASRANVSTAFDAQIPLELSPDGYPLRLPEGVIAHKLALRNVQLHAMPGR
jgi:hypothetical protein